MTAENGHGLDGRRRPRPRFNEAAADDRGKPARYVAVRILAARASMRPRPMTAENADGDIETAAGATASMRPRPMTAENTVIDSRITGAARGFNEAAADDRGKHVGAVDGRAVDVQALQ